MNKILTIVVPAYDMEQYLTYCLDSLCVHQHQEDLEVLVINDGSKDATSAIAHNYETNYPDIFRVIDKGNGNYGSCINRGLTEACGKYIKILDADDSFDTQNFEYFLSFLKETDADLILSDFAVVDTERRVQKVIKYRLGNGTIFRMDDVCQTPVFQNMQMHAVTYRKENIVALEYKQTEGISYTDQQWIFIPMISVRSVAYFNKYVYKYLIGRSGQTINPEVKLKNLSHTRYCALEMAKMYGKYKYLFNGKPVQAYLYARIIPCVKEIYVFVLSHYNQTNRQLLIDFDKQLKEVNKDIYDLIGSKEISSFKGFAYISYWRNHPYANKVIMQILGKAYLWLLRMKRKGKVQQEMALP